MRGAERMAHVRQSRKAKGDRRYDIWLSAATIAVLDQVKFADESVDACVARGIEALPAVTGDMPVDQQSVTGDSAGPVEDAIDVLWRAVQRRDRLLFARGAYGLDVKRAFELAEIVMAVLGDEGDAP